MLIEGPRTLSAMSENPAHGRTLFETVLVHSGRAVELDRHLARLTRSAETLYGCKPPATLADDATAAARGRELARMRIELTVDEAGRTEHLIEVTPLDPGSFFPTRADGARLRSIPAPGGPSEHKLAARQWLEGIEAQLGEEVPLLVEDGLVLEAGRANIFLVAGGCLITPPLDGRILPGTARAVVLELAAELGIAAEERPLRLEELSGADEVFLTSSLRGIRPVRQLDGENVGGGEEVSARLAARLRGRWLDAHALS